MSGSGEWSSDQCWSLPILSKDCTQGRAESGASTESKSRSHLNEGKAEKAFPSCLWRLSNSVFACHQYITAHTTAEQNSKKGNIRSKSSRGRALIGPAERHALRYLIAVE